MNARILRWPVRLSPVVAGLLLVPGLGTRVDSLAAPPPSDKSIFVGALDDAGRPVKDLTLADFRVREDKTDREITEVKLTTQPLNIELLVDTSKGVESIVQDLRKAVAAFVRQVHVVSPDAAIEIMEFGQAAVRIVPFTTSDEDLQKGINRIVGKPQANSVLLEAIIEANNNLAKRPSPRRAIVAVNVEPSDEQSREDPNKIVMALKKSVAQLWSVSYQTSVAKNAQRDVVLNQLTRIAGGNREFIVGISAMETVLKSYADALTTQYEVVYKRPDKSAQEVQVGTTRGGVKLHASGFPPQ
jgi:VWFA-related protein